MSAEKIPEFRMVGGASSEAKEEYSSLLTGRRTEHLKNLSEEELRLLKEEAFPLSGREKRLLSVIDSETNRLMVAAGMEPSSVPPENYHIVPEKVFLARGRKKIFRLLQTSSDKVSSLMLRM